MHTQDTQWLLGFQYQQRNALMLLVAVCIIYLLLKLDVKFELGELSIEKSLSVELSKFIEPEPEVTPVPDETQPPEPSEEPVLAEPAPILNEVVEPVSPQPSEPEKSPQLNIEPAVQERIELPGSGQILDSFYSGRSKQQEVSKEFQKFEHPTDEFIYFEVDEPDWNKIVKLINEEVDKPRTQMRFYSSGIEGKFERLMDKITYTKTFTTKYGTKISCGLVGVIVACGWK